MDWKKNLLTVTMGTGHNWNVSLTGRPGFLYNEMIRNGKIKVTQMYTITLYLNKKHHLIVTSSVTMYNE